MRASTYFFKFFARERFVPSHIEVRPCIGVGGWQACKHTMWRLFHLGMQPGVGIACCLGCSGCCCMHILVPFVTLDLARNKCTTRLLGSSLSRDRSPPPLRIHTWIIVCMNALQLTAWVVITTHMTNARLDCPLLLPPAPAACPLPH